MTYNADRLATEINAILDDLAERGEVINPAWIAQLLCERHSAGLEGEDAEFWYDCAHAYIKREATRWLRLRTGDPSNQETDPVASPARLRELAEEHHAHAEELRRYREERGA